jgi:membrane peptidoglycan carboxypeptidase
MRGKFGRQGKVLGEFKPVLALLVLIVLIVSGLLLGQELRSSHYQARFFADMASKATFAVGPGPSPSIRFPHSAPYDDRLGYSALPARLKQIAERDFAIVSQARISPGMADIVDAGYFAPYAEKTQAGLQIFDCRRDVLFSERYPRRIYARFDDVPRILIDSLLFIENRELLDTQQARRNPAVEWSRLANAVWVTARQTVTGDAGRSPGGSTLATQIEKYRHSSEGRTGSIGEKLQQMVSASLRAYQGGEDTTEARRQIVLAYINTMPLSAKPGFGEVHGIGDGLWAWYGRDFGEFNRVMHSEGEKSSDVSEQALLYKQALSLLISQRRPSWYFDDRQTELAQLTDSHLRLLAEAGVITPALRDDALKVPLDRPAGRTPSTVPSFVTQKAANAVRTHLGGLLGGSAEHGFLSLYELDRLDLQVSSTLDSAAQGTVTTLLRELRDPAKAKAAGLSAKQLLAQGDPAKVIYSFTLYERRADANYLRVQTDNFDQPLNINEGTKLDLGSTAKLRTLVTYLDIMAKLHARLSPLTPAQLKALDVDRQDVLTRWAADYLAGKGDKSLAALLEAALERRYSASPGEAFFTGGGLHRFDNFSPDDNSRTLSVRDALKNSVNLVFIRLMRDVVHHYMFLTPGSSARLLQDAADPRRADYLARFADREGQVFMRRFLVKYQNRTAQQAQDLLLLNRKLTASRLAAIFRTLEPAASLEAFSAFVNDHLPDAQEPDAARLSQLYAQVDPASMSLADRGYLAGVHPLELWLVGYLRSHPGASQKEVMQASAAERQTVYAWLFATHRKQAQDRRILGLLEAEGFLEIQRQWASMGYPFESLVPSYATALGASADRPAALAEMMGILVNDGVRKPSARIASLHFAEATPYETRLQFQPDAPLPVLAPEVARAVKGAMRLVVSAGTARRVNTAFTRPDGSPIAIGGKTGTGDQRFDSYGAGGRLIASRVVNRSATFVFHIDERFFGTVIAYVPGSGAAAYDFTSALPVQLLKVLAPGLMPLINAEAVAGAETLTGACAK